MGAFRFKRFTISNDRAALKLGTDAVLLGAAMSLSGKANPRVLDIGTGTGVIALMAAQRCPGAQVEAIDIDPPSAQEAADNFAASPWADRLEAKNVALEDFDPGCSYDHIFSNPPYYEDSLRNPDGREATARHTVEMSWRDIAAFAAGHLGAGGHLSLILPAACERELRRGAGSFGLYPFRTVRVRTTGKKPPGRLIMEFRLERGTEMEEELVLQDGPARTAQYTELTKDFYL